MAADKLINSPQQQTINPRTSQQAAYVRPSLKKRIARCAVEFDTTPSELVSDLLELCFPEPESSLDASNVELKPYVTALIEVAQQQIAHGSQS